MQELALGDAALVELARAGDVEAMAGLFERYRASLYASAMSMLRNREDALDAVQETCVIALARLASVRDPAAVGGWLHTVLRNTCRMRLRRASSDGRRARDELPTVIPAPEDVIDAHAL